MRVSSWRAVTGCLLALAVIALNGCSNGDGGVVVPNKPPLSAEAAKAKAKKQQQDKVKSMQDQAKRKAKK